jgi:hypothetical protein
MDQRGARGLIRADDAAARGSVSRASSPPAARFSSVSLPPCSSATLRAIVMRRIFRFGESVEGYDVRVLNERAVRGLILVNPRRDASRTLH